MISLAFYSLLVAAVGIGLLVLGVALVSVGRERHAAVLLPAMLTGLLCVLVGGGGFITGLVALAVNLLRLAGRLL